MVAATEMTEPLLRDALRMRYPLEAWALFDELRNGTGWRSNQRSADAVAFGLWPSRGLDLHGFEIKVDRRDLKRELDAPQKADEIAQYCDFWWLVLATPKLAEGLIIPRTWGVLVPSVKNGKTTLVEQKAAVKMKAKKLDRLMVASILRNAQANTERRLDGYVRPDKVEERAKELADIETKQLRREVERNKIDYTGFREDVELAKETRRMFGLASFASAEQQKLAGAIATAFRTQTRENIARGIAHNVDQLEELLDGLRKAQALLATWPIEEPK